MVFNSLAVMYSAWRQRVRHVSPWSTTSARKWADLINRQRYWRHLKCQSISGADEFVGTHTHACTRARACVRACLRAAQTSAWRKSIADVDTRSIGLVASGESYPRLAQATLALGPPVQGGGHGRSRTGGVSHKGSGQWHVKYTSHSHVHSSHNPKPPINLTRLVLRETACDSPEPR